MTEMSNHERPVELPDVPAGEEISPGDAIERAGEEPEDQQNRVDPVWSDTPADQVSGDQGGEPGAEDR